MRNCFIILVASLLVTACGQNSKDQSQSKDQLQKKISELKDSLNNVTKPKKIQKYARDMAKAAGEYTDRYPKDSMTPEYLYLLGDIHFSYLENSETAFNNLQELRNKYPKHDKAPYALFTQGFYYEQLNKEQKARQFYRKFLEKYPDHKFTEDVRLSMKGLGKSPEEQLKQALEKRNKRDSIQ